MSNAILFVDDEIIILTSMQAQVKKHFGNMFRYETALNADEAWEVIEELVKEGVTILIIISDWLMPRIRGDEFLVQVHARFPQIKKVIISGQADESSIEKLKVEINLHAYVRKPWSAKELIHTIDTALV